MRVLRICILMFLVLALSGFHGGCDGTPENGRTEISTPVDDERAERKRQVKRGERLPPVAFELFSARLATGLHGSNYSVFVRLESDGREVLRKQVTRHGDHAQLDQLFLACYSGETQMLRLELQFPFTRKRFPVDETYDQALFHQDLTGCRIQDAAGHTLLRAAIY